ncbi:MAG: alkaline shock response membrane anchor protein AmaP [Dehalococcoidia bacterium]|nr:alkaline shock response membrane anchor protein AmaP [Dehalococcoidia bacterium]
MNVVRRLFLALYSILLIAAAGGMLALAWNEGQQLDLNVGNFSLQGLIDTDDPAKAIWTVIMAAVIALGLFTLFIALAPGVTGSSKGTLRMRQADGGMVEVTADALESMLQDELEQLPEVREAYPRVRLSGGAVDTETTVVIEPSANISSVTGAVADATTRALRENVGVTSVRRPSIRIRYDEMNARPAGVRGRSKPQTATYAERELPTTRPAAPPEHDEEPWPSHPEAPTRTGD